MAQTDERPYSKNRVPEGWVVKKSMVEIFCGGGGADECSEKVEASRSKLGSCRQSCDFKKPCQNMKTVGGQREGTRTLFAEVWFLSDVGVEGFKRRSTSKSNKSGGQKSGKRMQVGNPGGKR